VPTTTRTAVSVRQLRSGDERNFVYVLVDGPSREAMVIDCGGEVDPILSVVKEEGLEVRFAVATHHHSDHTATIWQLSQLLDAKIVAFKGSPLVHDVSVVDREILHVGATAVKVLHTPGHTEDSICLYDGRNLFSGDTVLIGSCGRTDMPGGSARKMYRSIQTVILRLPGGTMVYPGHETYEVASRTLSEEMKQNPALSAKSYAEYLRRCKGDYTRP